MASQAEPTPVLCAGSVYGCGEMAAPGEKLCGPCKAVYSNWAWREFMRLGGPSGARETEVRAWGAKVGLAKLWRQYVEWRQNDGLDALLEANRGRVKAEKSKESPDG